MRKGVLACAVASVIVGNPISLNIRPSFHAAQAITGRVSPANGADIVWVIGAKDSLSGPVVSGIFSLVVDPGIYKLIVDARSPYKDVLLDNLKIKQNQSLDVGEIILQQ
jgi:hypothetical protein